jgi:hypothetical protein
MPKATFVDSFLVVQAKLRKKRRFSKEKEKKGTGS